jgi:golgi SNAP receptor complex member 2
MPSDRSAGQLNASLTSFNRTLDDYNQLARQELVPEKQTKALERVKTFKSELGDYRDRLDHLKQEAADRVRPRPPQQHGMADG